MMKKWMMVSALISGMLYAAPNHPQLKAFPEAKEGEVRHVIVLPKLENEQDHKIEILVGKLMMTDGVNKMGMGGSLTRETIQGWGYSYYQAKLGGTISTLMAPMPGTPKEERFVHIPGELVRYNSRLPVVIYAPEGSMVKYRVWTAGEMKDAE